MSNKRQRTLSGCSVESHDGRLRLRFRALGPDGRRQQIARATGKPDTPENYEAVRRLADLVGAALAAGRTLQEIDTILGHTPSLAVPPGATSGSAKQATGPTVSEHVERWLTTQAPLVRKAQIIDYRRHIRNYVVPLIGDEVALADLQPTDTRSVQAELLSRGLSVKYVRNIVAGSWRAFLRDAAEDGLVPPNVYPHLKWPEWDFPEADPFTSDERDAILNYFRTHRFRCRAPGTATGYESRPNPVFHAFVHLLFWSGLRPSEATGSQDGDYDLQAGRLYIRRSRHLGEVNRPKTRSARRTVELFPTTVQLLAAIRPLHVTPESPMFLNIAGRPLDQQAFTNSHWYDCLRSLDIRQRGLYCTKDTFVTTALLAGVKPAWLEQQTGVSYETLRRHYGRWMAGEVESELRHFEAFDRTLFEGTAREVLPQRARAVTGRAQLTDFAREKNWSQGDSNPCYRRERPAS
jgi:integrase